MSGTRRGPRIGLDHLLDAGLVAEVKAARRALGAGGMPESALARLGAELAETRAALTQTMPRFGFVQVPSPVQAMFDDAERLSKGTRGVWSALAWTQVQQSSAAVMHSLRPDSVQWPVLDHVFRAQKVVESLQLLTRPWDRGWLAELRRVGRLPPNWIDVDDEMLDRERLQVALMGGVPLAVVPRASTVEAVLRKASPGAQRQVLWSRRVSVLTDCRVVLDRTEPQPAALVSLLLEAVAAAEDGHWAAAQALAANVIDSALSHRGHRVIHTDVQQLRKDAQRKTPPPRDELVGQWVTRLQWVALMLVPAYASFQNEETAAARRFNRHAAAHHGARAGVYSKVNGLCAVMLATASLWLLNFLGDESPLKTVSEQAA